MYNGVLKMPWYDSAQNNVYNGPNYFYEDTICINGRFAFETRQRVPYSAGGEARYRRLGRNMYFPSFYGGMPNGFFFDNGTKVIGASFFRGIGYPGINRDSIFLSIQYGENDVYTNEIIKSTGLKNLGSWVNLKVQTQNNKVYIILNNAVIDSFTFSSLIQNFVRYNNTTYGYDLQTDFWKMYDENDRLRYFEDFNGCDKLAKQTMPRCGVDCQQQFVNYFNTQRGTTYSFTQIDSLYFNICGTHPEPCYANPIDCNQLNQSIKDYYTSKNNITFDSIGVEHGVWTYEQNTKNCNFSQVQLINRFASGIFDGHPFADSCGKNYQVNYKIPICSGNQFTLISRMQVYDTMPYINRVPTLTDINFWLDNAKYVTVRFKHPYPGTGYAVDIISERGTTAFSFIDANAGSFNGFQTWKNVKVTFKNDSIIVCLDSLSNYLEIARIFYPGNFTKISKFGFAGTQYGVQMDWVKIYDAANTLQYFEDFVDNTNFIKVPNAFICSPANCTSDFTAFYNTRFKTNLSYQQVSKIYQNCGIYMQPCGLNELLLCGKTEPLFPPVFLVDNNPCADSSSLAFVIATELYRNYQDSLKNAFDNAYLKKCKQAFKTESFTVTHPQSEYHYTLYYYDQAGNLVKTVPPSGVDLTNYNNTTWLASVATARKNGTSVVPTHSLSLQTNYRYNTLNQVMAQTTPDAGLSSFWYDRLGRLIVSQNAKQKAVSATENNRNYSYTKYDVLGRITEVAQLKNATTTVLTQATAQDTTAYKNWFTAATASGVNIEMVTRTVYDIKYGNTNGIPGLYPKNLRNRVAYTTYTDGNSTANYNAGTFYSYDIHGNVDTLLQDYGPSGGITNIMNSNGSRWKRMVYKYDLISGKVNHVAYQPNYFNGTAMVISQDALYHRYSYDAENRLTLAETSTDSTIWQKDARYTYYKHGPLARTVIGQRQVQGLDYAYTLQGWLKGVNSSVLNATFDMGRDGDATNAPTSKIARDAYGFNLNYYLGDYVAISGNNVFAGIGTLPVADLRNLYNGNITSMAVNLGKFNSTTGAAGDSALLYNYKYDQLNRIVSADAFRGLNTTTNTWNNSLTKLTQYQERISYDANGNILKFLRNGNKTATPIMDSLSYKYNAGNNQLNWVKDNVAAATYADDIDNNQAANNYLYDAIGNLVRDSAEGIRLSLGGIKWNVYGKITEINKVDSSASVFNSGRIKKITYSYDAAGNRISKKVEKYTNALVDYTWYVRDASGNTMSTYSYTSTTATDLTANNLTQNELYLYGSSRLGSLTVNRNVEVTKQTTDTTYTMPSGIAGGLKVPFVTGLKQYELSNHLGNVLVTVSDKKLQHTSNGTAVDYYTADVITANDFYSFGMIEPGRKFVQGVKKYRYSFNSQEKTDEISGTGNHTTAEFWEYDTRLGRRWNVDPVYKHSPYECFAGNPIWYSDPMGLDTPKNKTTVAALQFIANKYHFINPVDKFIINLFPATKTGDRVLGAAIGTAEAVGATIQAPIEAIKHPVQTVVGIMKLQSGDPMIGISIYSNYLNSKDKYGVDYTNSNYIAYGITTIGLAFAAPETIASKPAVTLNSTSKLGVVAAERGLTNPLLVQKSATLAEKAIGGTGGVAGTVKHQYASTLLNRYQSINGSRGLETGLYFNNGVGNRGFLDVIDHTNGIIYDYKFGNAVMSPAQFGKYLRNFGLPIQVIKP